MAQLRRVSWALEGTGPFQPQVPAPLQPEARHGREGTHHGGGVCPSILRRRAPIVTNTIRPPTALAPTAIQDDLNSADFLEGGLDLGEKERPFGRHHRVMRSNIEPSSSTRGADPVGHHRVSGIPIA